MMRLFKKREKATTTDDALAEKIAENIVARQKQLADYLNAKSSRLSRQTIAYLLTCFCIAFGGYCVYLLFDAIIK